MVSNNLDRYILLPQLSSISVKDYSLFKKDWSYKVDPSLNLFIGVNGLGKTTTTGLIIYGLVGSTSSLEHDSLDINIDYFKDRVPDTFSNQARLDIEFYIGKHTLNLTRSLRTNEILSYQLDGIAQLENNYKRDLLRLTRLSRIDDLAFILEKFLIREEEGNYLLWDFKEQSRLLQLLINPVGFEEAYSNDVNELSTITAEINREKDSKIKTYLKRIDDLREDKLKTSKNSRDLNQSQKAIQTKKASIVLKENLRDKYIATLRLNVDKLTKLHLQEESDFAELEHLNEKLLNFEKVFYQSAYSDNTLLTAIHKLKSYNSCIYCDTDVSETSKKQILEALNKGDCPVCSSSFKNRSTEDETSSEDVQFEIVRIEKKIKAIKSSRIKLKKDEDIQEKKNSKAQNGIDNTEQGSR